MAIKKLKAYFFAILVLSYLLVNSNQNYMEMRNCSIRRKTWTEKNRKKNEKGIRSSVDYAKKPSTTTIGQIKIRNINNNNFQEARCYYYCYHYYYYFIISIRSVITAINIFNITIFFSLLMIVFITFYYV